jgi:CubicO group peptidase (beta-lactamase class C family)
VDGPLDTDRLRRFVEAEAADDRFSGAVAVEHGGAVVLEVAVACADVECTVPNRPQTRFNLASVTKMCTAVAVLQLVERGDLALMATVAELLPDVGVGRAADITVEHLLVHRSGLGDHWNARCWERRAQLRTTDDYLALVEGEEPRFEPGSAASYSNTGYVLLGGIVERVTGRRYDDVLRDDLCRRAGLAGDAIAHVDSDRVGPADGVARGCTSAVDWIGTIDPERRHDSTALYPVRGSAAVGLHGTAVDVLRFGLALRRGALLGDAWVGRMLGPGEGPDGAGFGTQRVPWSGGVAVGHGGRGFGTAACLLFLPEADVSVCILANRDRPADKRVFAEVDRLLTESSR